MKKTNRFFTYAACILLAILVACGTIMVGAADATASDTSEVEVLESTTEDLSYTPETVPTKGDITDAILDFVSTNEFQDDLSEAGDEIKKFSWNAEDFLKDLIEKIQSAVERVTEFLRHLFRVAKF